MQLHIDPAGVVRCIYDEALDLATLGAPRIRRASHVEPDEHGRWWAEMEGGTKLGPFALRSQALAAEKRYLEERLSDHQLEEFLHDT